MKKKRKWITPTAVALVVVILILINNHYSATNFVGYVELEEKQEQSNNYLVTVNSPDYGEIVLDFKPSYEFNVIYQGESTKMAIDEIWDWLEYKEYYVHIQINRFPYNLFHEYKLLDFYFD